MATNPSKQGAILNPATQRGSKLNDPTFKLAQGYSPFDNTHHELLTTRFGEYTPFMHLDTVPADRHVIKNNLRTIHNRIDGNLLSVVNQYDETFFVSLANLIPNAYERFIPNPVKGDDLPNSALPQIPIASWLVNFLCADVVVNARYVGNTIESVTDSFTHAYVMQITDIVPSLYDTVSAGRFAYQTGFMTMLAYILSRGQLLDMFGFALETQNEFDSSNYNSNLQALIDNYFNALFDLVSNGQLDSVVTNIIGNNVLSNMKLNSDEITLTFGDNYRFEDTFDLKSKFRDFLFTSFENGEFPTFVFDYDEDGVDTYLNEYHRAYRRLLDALFGIFNGFYYDDDGTYLTSYNSVGDLNASATPFEMGYINPLKLLAYQLCIAQYGTNDLIDNIYTADLYMQNLRSIMFPATDGLSQEPIYNYNGVEFEYDLMTYGAWYRSFFDVGYAGSLSRMYLVASTLFVIRRSLRYGDMFSTSRPNMLAVGDMYINVVDGKVSPVDVTKNILVQRYLNMANYLGQRVDSLYASVYGVIPSDRPSCPRYISHRKTELYRQITNNTADEQGKQSTNLVADTSGDKNSIDVFIDDYGVILSVVSYDVLPVYTSGIDRTFAFSDRYDYYNPQLQNIGDQPVLLSEIYGQFDYQRFVFGFQMRNAEYKYKVSRCHGGLVNDLPGFAFRYPPYYLKKGISPQFIRDKPMYFDQLAQRMTGTSPANYYHFIVSATNEVHSARMMQATPPILF